jgi:hypothetical protein
MLRFKTCWQLHRLDQAKASKVQHRLQNATLHKRAPSCKLAHSNNTASAAALKR